MTGEIVSHYRILEKLGEGGMGIVFKAEDTRLRRTVAIKFIHPKAAAQPEFRERFRREAQASAVIDHPNVCQVHEFQESGDQLFIVMNLIEGRNLAQSMADNRLSPSTAIDIAIQIAQGLKAAHQKGIIHRDLKPGNIMLTFENRVQITDFGLAFLADRSRLTAPGTIMGTFAYMSPEQAQAKTVDRRSDLWALGCLLYEMIAGNPPFLDAQGRADLRSVLRAKPDLRALSGISPELHRIASKLLQKDASMRYQHADDLIVDLRMVLKELPESTPSVAKPTMRLHPNSATLTAAPAVSGPPYRGKRWRVSLWSGLIVLLLAVTAILFRVLHLL